MKKSFLIIGIFLMVLSVVQISALDQEREDRLRFGHVLLIKEIKTEPSTLIPGESAVLKLSLENTGKESAEDVRITLKLPNEIGFLNDVSKRKIPILYSEEIKNFEFNLIALPDIAEGIYKATLETDYVNILGGEREDDYNLSIIIKSIPKIFAKIEDSEIYKGNNLGDVTINFINNDLADVKFLTVQLLDSSDYDIISSNREYIGDLDSDDFESVDFRLKVKNGEGKIVLPLKIDYKDSLNKDYSENIEVVLVMRTAEDMGVSSNRTSQIVIAIIVILIIAYYLYKKSKKKKTNRNKY